MSKASIGILGRKGGLGVGCMPLSMGSIGSKGRKEEWWSLGTAGR